MWLQQLSRETMIKAANGKAHPALDVFAHALRYFRQHALQELSDQTSTALVDDDVRWVISVPAIWKPPARQFMRIAAMQVLPNLSRVVVSGPEPNSIWNGTC